MGPRAIERDATVTLDGECDFTVTVSTAGRFPRDDRDMTRADDDDAGVAGIEEWRT